MVNRRELASTASAKELSRQECNVQEQLRQTAAEY